MKGFSDLFIARPIGTILLSIGLVIVGGLTLGTLLTLFVVPTVYSLVGRIHKPHEEHDEAHAHGHHPEGKGNHAPGHLTPAE